MLWLITGACDYWMPASTAMTTERMDPSCTYRPSLGGTGAASARRVSIGAMAVA